MKILVVDDDEVSRLTLASILREQELHIVQARGGEEAWTLLVEGLRPAVCCIDVMMPRVDGLELLRRMRAHRFLKDLPVVLISSAAERETVQAAMAQGIAGYLLKPFRAGAARACVQRAWRDYSAQRSEPAAATRRRLHLESPQLEQMLEELRADAEGLAQALDTGLRGPDTEEALRRLHSGCLALGLWKAAIAAGEASEPHASAAEAVREVHFLVQEQLCVLREPTAPERLSA